MFGSTTIGILLLITHILACITVGILFRFWRASDDTDTLSLAKNKATSSSRFVHLSNLGGVLAESITSSISTILMIGGFVVIFSSVISILKASGILTTMSMMISPLFHFFHLDSVFISPLLTGLLEITNGINLIAHVKVKEISLSIIFTAFLLGFGGISVLLQVWSITSKTDLSIKPYVYGKLLHGVLAALYTFLAISIFPFLNLDL
jgi:sporulation integral membrane protein YlbJ